MNETELVKMCEGYMSQHGLIANGWVLQTTQNASSFGDCYDPTKTIRMSAFLARTQSLADTTDTILHEIAHALVGCSHNHDDVWKAKCIQIGAKPSSRKKFNDETRKLVMLEKVKWVMLFKGKIVKTYMRKPNKSTIAKLPTMWLGSCKKESYGKLTVAEYNPRIHKDFHNA